MRACRPLAHRLDADKIGTTADTAIAPEAETHRLTEPMWLLLEDRDGQALAALPAAIRKDLRSAARGHAGKEAVRTEAARVVRLIGAFRLCHDSIRRKETSNK